MTDEELTRSVAEALSGDPRIDDEGVAVSVLDGSVILRGTVGSFHQKREATKAAERVPGIVAVDNGIDVEILTHDRREDADLRGDVLEALMLDSQVPMTVNARVADGCVVLTGDVQWQYQREEAERAAGNVAGVRAVVNEILPGDSIQLRDDVERRIRKAFLTTARLDAEHLDVAVADGTITLTGRVQSDREHDEALAAAWAIAVSGASTTGSPSVPERGETASSRLRTSRIRGRPRRSYGRRRTTTSEEEMMALSDQLSRLSVRAKQAENRAAAAKDQAREQLEHSMLEAREGAQRSADKVRGDATATKNRVDSGADKVRRSWEEHVAEARARQEERKTRHAADRSESEAEDAEAYAVFAIDLAYSAIEEADYAVLDAVLARQDADMAAQKVGG